MAIVWAEMKPLSLTIFPINALLKGQLRPGRLVM